MDQNGAHNRSIEGHGIIARTLRVTTAPRQRGTDPSDPPGDRQGKPLLHRSCNMAAKKKKKAKKKK
jgi:hypothetical protein